MKAVLLLLILIIISPLAVTQTIQTDIPSLVKGADLIFTGKVAGQKSEWNKDKTAIFTRVTLQVEEYLKGDKNQKTITVVHPGGEIGEVGELYTHVPSFSSDESVLLFAKEQSNSTDYSVFGGELGKITLYPGAGGEKQTSQRMRISDLKTEIRRIVSQQ